MSDGGEGIRLVIWDLDGTFWRGTLTEGGITWRDEAERTVRMLAARGIISAICSKNDPASIEAVLAAHGIADFFVFNSISWDAKGPRLAALIRAVQLRPESVLFIDDNPANLAEARHFVPAMQVAGDEIIGGLLDDARCVGKPDPDFKRLAQYRLLERRQRDEASTGGDASAFLRASGITVKIEHDVEAHAGRAIELINRTNQLNFTKARLPEAPEAARAALHALLVEHTVQAGLLRVRDNYGDHGYCGIYVLRSHRRLGRELLHFAFSCRILGMGVETWLYRRLNRPALKIVGSVVSDVFGDPRDIDWISTEAGGGAARAADAPVLSYVLARGGCDMRAISHYFGLVAGRVFEEFDTVRGGQMPQVNHSLIAVQAMRGIDARAVADFAPLGFLREDFNTVLAGELPPGPAVWLLGFGIELGMPIFRHRETAALLPAYVPGLGRGDLAALMRGEAAGEDVDPTLAAHLRAHFDYMGPVADVAFQTHLRTLLGRAGRDVSIFVLLANTRFVARNGREGVFAPLHRQNELIREVASEYNNVEPLAPLTFMSEAEIANLHRPQHYERMVYYRIFRHIMNCLNKTPP